MFTGIVKSLGTVSQLEATPVFTLTVSAPEIASSLAPGDSIAVNGVCLSATRIESAEFDLQLSPETLSKSHFDKDSLGTEVNLELPLTMGERLGGHLVQGHADGTCRMLERKAIGDFLDLFFSLPHELENYVIHKGSIAVNGVSLTVSSLEKSRFGVSLIPVTLEKTNLGSLNPGDRVNLEVDMFAKYAERFFLNSPSLAERLSHKIWPFYRR